MSYCIMIVAIGADEKRLAMLSSLTHSNGLASAVLEFLCVVTVCCRSVTMS